MHRRQRTQFRRRFHRLGHVHIHFVPIKIGIVRCCGIHTQPKRFANVHRFDTVAHHRHLVQRRLAVEQHRVTCQQMTMHHITDLQGLGFLFQQMTVIGPCEKLQRQTDPIRFLDNTGTWIIVRAIGNHLA